MQIVMREKQDRWINKILKLIELNEKDGQQSSIFSGLVDLASDIGLDPREYDRIKKIIHNTREEKYYGRTCKSSVERV